jgi:chromosome segregation ATPase
MTSTPGDTLDTREVPELKVAQLEALGRAVITDMRAMRELLSARTTALEDCRTALLEFESQLLQRHADVERREHELCDCYEQREAELTAREEQCTQTEARLAAEAEHLAAAQAELQQQQGAIEPRLAAAAAAEADAQERLATVTEREQRVAAEATALAVKIKAVEEDLSRTRIVETDLAQRSAEVTAAQAELERLRGDLTAREQDLSGKTKELLRRGTELDAQQAALQGASAELEQDRAKLAEEEAVLRRAQAEAAASLTEIQAVRRNLASLQKQLQEELDALAEQKGDLLLRYGLPEGGGNGQKGNGVLPKLPDQKASESLERFQKLCRDAKRKAIGAM